ncbi:MAG: hypothetical protein [Microviridae sp.]|nr:MAG: hypothetical protein [Microviridae sp.]
MLNRGQSSLAEADNGQIRAALTEGNHPKNDELNDEKGKSPRWTAKKTNKNATAQGLPSPSKQPAKLGCAITAGPMQGVWRITAKRPARGREEEENSLISPPHNSLSP